MRSNGANRLRRSRGRKLAAIVPNATKYMPSIHANHKHLYVKHKPIYGTVVIRVLVQFQRTGRSLLLYTLSKYAQTVARGQKLQFPSIKVCLAKLNIRETTASLQLLRFPIPASENFPPRIQGNIYTVP